MASIALVAIASAAASSAGITGIAALAITTAAGIAGTFIDQLLFAKSETIEGPKLDETRFRGSAMGTPITRVWGCARLPAATIWATRFREVVEEEKHGKSLGGGTTTETTKYFVSFAVSVAEGPVTGINKIWLDNRLIDQSKSKFTIRKYLGTSDQQPDPKIVAVEGADVTPAFRHTAYVVFEEFPATDFGNHIPQVNVEVCRDPIKRECPPEVIGVDNSPEWADFGNVHVHWGKRKAYMFNETAGGGDQPTLALVFDLDSQEFVEELDLTISSDGRMNLQGLDPVTGYLVGAHSQEASISYWHYVYDPETKTMVTEIDVGAALDAGAFDETIQDSHSPIFVVTDSLDNSFLVSLNVTTDGVSIFDFPSLGYRSTFKHTGYLSMLGAYGEDGEAFGTWLEDNGVDIRIYRYYADNLGAVQEELVGTLIPGDVEVGATFDNGGNVNVVPHYDSDTRSLHFTVLTDTLNDYAIGWDIESQSLIYASLVDHNELSSLSKTMYNTRLGGSRWIFDAGGPAGSPGAQSVDIRTGETELIAMEGDYISDRSSFFDGQDTCECLYRFQDLFSPDRQILNKECFGTFEVVSQSPLGSTALAVTLMPEYGEYAYQDEVVIASSDGLFGDNAPLNAHREPITPDILIALDELEGDLVSVDTVAVTAGWTCDDLRADTAKIRPRPEATDSNRTIKKSKFDWVVSDTARADADSTVSLQSGGLPYYGGTPSDKSVFSGLQELKERNFNLTFVCKLQMDIPPDNTLTDPYTGSAGQSAFPWPGRITLNAAPGQTGSTYKAAGAATEIGTFFGDETAADFGAWDPTRKNGGTIPFSGTATSWTYRRMVLHYAKLCEQAGMEGPLDVFVLGTDLKGLTHIQDDVGNFPAVDELIALLAEVKSIWTGAGKEPPQFTYAAHWTEWSLDHADDGSGDILFNLDPLWSHADIAAIGINFLAPLSDWRDGDHLDGASFGSLHDEAYLQSQIEGGEHYDYTYESFADRESQTRTTIDDPNAADEDWIFRWKDIRNWWLNAHHNRPGGVRDASATGWTAQSKPVWLMKVGTGGHNKSTNRPDAQPDSRSEDEFAKLAYFSNGAEDVSIQVAAINAVLKYWDLNVNNPDSTVYTGKMIDLNYAFVYGWGKRPFPEWPNLDNRWGDTSLYRLGHWLQGRTAASGGSSILAGIIESAGLEPADYDVSDLSFGVRGYFVSNTISVREIINPLAATFFFDAYESGGQVKFRSRGGRIDFQINEDDMVLNESRGDQEVFGPFRSERGQETELPGFVRVNFIGTDPNYSKFTTQAHQEVGDSLRVSESSPNIVIDSGDGQLVADTLLHEAWVARESAETKLMPSKLRIDPSDVIEVTYEGRTTQYRAIMVGDEYERSIRLVRTEKALYDRVPTLSITAPIDKSVSSGIITLQFLDLPLMGVADEKNYAPWLAATADPWPGAAVYKVISGTFDLDKTLDSKSTFLKTLTELPAGTHGIFLRGTTLDVEVPEGVALESLSDLAVLSGKNVAAVVHSTGAHEIIQWTDAELIATNQYRLSGLLKAQLGTEVNIDDPLAVGSRLVLLGGAVEQSNIPGSMRNAEITWKYGPQGGSPDDSNFEEQLFTPEAVGLRPLSPVALRARKDHSTNDIHFQWIRRTRIDGDIWDNTDVPLGETVEKYKILIYNGSTIVREIVVDDQTTGTYTDAQQTTDGFAVGTSLDWGVKQFSGEYGYGAERKITSTFLA